MKNNVVLLCVITFGCFTSQYATRTFLSIPVPFHPTSPERQTMTHDEMRDFTQEKLRNFSVTLFGGESTDPCKIANFFLPFNKTCLIAGSLGSEAVRNHQADLIANYFNVLTGSPRSDASSEESGSDNIFPIIDTWTFQSKLQFCPVHKYFGIGLLYHQHLSSHFDKGWWFEIAMPIMCVKNSMGMCETIEYPGGPNGDDPQRSSSFFSKEADQYAYQCMTDALRSGKFRYGKIDCREYRRSRWGVADLELRLGYTYFKEPSHHLSSYAGCLLPTGNTPTGEFMFEKIVGYNGNTGFFLGTNGGIAVWSHDRNFLTFEFDTSATLFLDKIQVRSFDLYGKPWGRYIWVYPNNNVNSTLKPGINYLTKSVTVNYGSLRNINLAWVYTMSDFQGEIGYHFYSRDREKVCLAKYWHEDHALAALWYSNNNFIGVGESDVVLKSRSSATINNYLEVTNDIEQFKAFPVTANMTEDEVAQRNNDLKDNDIYLPIKECQLNLNSAANPSIVVHTVYVSLGYGWYNIVFPTFINLAGGYEFGDGPAVVDRWKLWFKIGVAF